MKIQLGIIMDPIESICVNTDSSFALLLEAQRRTWDIFYFEANDLFLHNGHICARMSRLHVYDQQSGWFEKEEKKIRALEELHVILMRKDPPVDKHYLYTTQLLDHAVSKGVLVVNHPQSLRDFNEKLFTTLFPHCCPPSLFTSSINDIKEFLATHHDIICKPLDGMGGISIFRLRSDDPNINVILETLTQFETQLIEAQRYISAIKKGDKRILMIDGQPLPYALARLPISGETRANLSAGGRGIGVTLNERDQWICEQLGSYLHQKNLLLVGIDVIGDYLTEINITSPTCIRELDQIYQINISEQVLNNIESKLKI